MIVLFVFIGKDDSEGDNGRNEFADEKVIQAFIIVFSHVCMCSVG